MIEKIFREGWMDEKNQREFERPVKTFDKKRGWMAEKILGHMGWPCQKSQKKRGWMDEKSPSNGSSSVSNSSHCDVSHRYGLPGVQRAPPTSSGPMRGWLLLLLLCSSWHCGQARVLDSNTTILLWASPGLGSGTAVPCAWIGSVAERWAAADAVFAPWPSLQLFGSWLHVLGWIVFSATFCSFFGGWFWVFCFLVDFLAGVGSVAQVV